MVHAKSLEEKFIKDGCGTKRIIVCLTSPEKGPLIVRDFGKDTYGSPLFFPNSEAWKAKR